MTFLVKNAHVFPQPFVLEDTVKAMHCQNGRVQRVPFSTRQRILTLGETHAVQTFRVTAVFLSTLTLGLPPASAQLHST